MLLGLTVHQPLLAIILAFFSHFALDALPHYGDDNHIGKRFIRVLCYDMIAAGLLLCALALWRPMYWQLGLVCGIVAASPDLMWLNMWIRELRHLPLKKSGLIKRFHKRIQWAEAPKNYKVEIIWCSICLILLVKLG